MEVYLIAIFVILFTFVVWVLSVETKTYAKPIITRTVIPITDDDQTSNIPNREVGFEYYTVPFKELDYNQALIFEVFVPIHVNTWSIESYNSKWELTNTQCQGNSVNSGESITVLLSPNELYEEEVKLELRGKLSKVYNYGFSKYNPDEKYNFVLRVPKSSYVKANAHFLTSLNIRLKIAEDKSPPKSCKMFNENGIVSDDAYKAAQVNIYKSYGDRLDTYTVTEEDRPYSIKTSFVSEKFTLGVKERLCIFYVDHSSNRGALYSRITVYNANTNEPIQTELTGIHSTRNHVKEGLKSGIIDINTPGYYYIREVVGPTRQRIKKICGDSVIHMNVTIVDPSTAKKSHMTLPSV